LAKRESIVWAQLTEEVDESKMFRALRANIIHSFDGYVVRAVTLKLGYPIITIHDSFGIDIGNTAKLIHITQEVMTALIHLNLFESSKTAAQFFCVDSNFILL
jgi:hypothetical protein